MITLFFVLHIRNDRLVAGPFVNEDDAIAAWEDRGGNGGQHFYDVVTVELPCPAYQRMHLS